MTPSTGSFEVSTRRRQYSPMFHRSNIPSISVTVQTGMITALCASTDLICYLTTVRSHTLWFDKTLTVDTFQPTALHTAFNEVMPKLYTNSLMSSLNYRAGWGYGTGGFGDTTNNTQNGHFSTNGPRFASMPASSSTGTMDIELAQKSFTDGSAVSWRSSYTITNLAL